MKKKKRDITEKTDPLGPHKHNPRVSTYKVVRVPLRGLYATYSPPIHPSAYEMRVSPHPTWQTAKNMVDLLRIDSIYNGR